MSYGVARSEVRVARASGRVRARPGARAGRVCPGGLGVDLRATRVRHAPANAADAPRALERGNPDSLNYPVYLRTMRRSFVVELHSLVHIGARRVPALRAWRTPALVAFRILVFPLSFALTWAEATRDDAGRAILPAVGALYALAVLFNAALLTAAVRTTARRRGDARVD